MKAWKASVQIAQSFLKKNREALIEILKDAREELESTRKEMKDMQKELSKSPVADDDNAVILYEQNEP